MKNKVILVGGGGYATEICGVIKRAKIFDILGYTDKIENPKLIDLHYLGDELNISSIRKSTKLAVLAVGQDSKLDLKLKLINNYLKNDFTFEKVIGISSIVDEKAIIGNGVVVRENCFISAGTKIGDYSTISDGANISYNTNIGKNCNVSLGVNIGIDVQIGNNVLIGLGSTIMNRVNIGDNCIIGSGSLINKDCEADYIYFGHPGKKYKRNNG